MTKLRGSCHRSPLCKLVMRQQQSYEKIAELHQVTVCLISQQCFIRLGAVLLPACAVACSLVFLPQAGGSCLHGFCSGEREEWAVSVTNRVPDQEGSVLHRVYLQLFAYTGGRVSANAVLICSICHELKVLQREPFSLPTYLKRNEQRTAKKDMEKNLQTPLSWQLNSILVLHKNMQILFLLGELSKYFTDIWWQI